MYAVIDFAGRQYKVSPGDRLVVDRLTGEPGDSLELGSLVLVRDDKVRTGEALKKAKVRATILEHLKGDKVLVFKYKAKKNYKRFRGHRQALTRIAIEEIGLEGLAPRPARAAKAEKPEKAAATAKAQVKVDKAVKATAAAESQAKAGKSVGGRVRAGKGPSTGKAEAVKAPAARRQTAGPQAAKPQAAKPQAAKPQAAKPASPEGTPGTARAKSAKPSAAKATERKSPGKSRREG